MHRTPRPIRPRRRLATLTDTVWAAAFPEQVRPLTRLRAYVAAGRRVWFRVDGNSWRRRGPVATEHIFFSRTQAAGGKVYDRHWTALCGKVFDAVEIVWGIPRFVVAAPKLENRCAGCLLAAERIESATKR